MDIRYNYILRAQHCDFPSTPGSYHKGPKAHRCRGSRHFPQAEMPALMYGEGLGTPAVAHGRLCRLHVRLVQPTTLLRSREGDSHNENHDRGICRENKERSDGFPDSRIHSPARYS